MITFRFTCPTCADSSWDIEMDEAKRRSQRLHEMYLENVLDRRTGERRGVEDTDFLCPSCGEGNGVTCEKL